MKTARAVSAGGLVLEDATVEARILLIARFGRRGGLVWGLPKGQVEKEESVEEAALREVTEETGIRAEMLAPLDTVDYWFSWAPDQTRYHKYVHYFLMRALGGTLRPQPEEVERVEWLPRHEARLLLRFDNERRLLDLVPSALARACGECP
ncbi:MAG: NUDIX hydrolase [Actinomycetota bacterium]